MAEIEISEFHSIPVTLRLVGKPIIVQSEKPGQKIRRGILRFFGTVEFAVGQFCGIELDNAEGKHNGSFKGIRYFQCPQDHGIFVPASRVFVDQNANKARPLSNVIPSTKQLKISDSRVSMQTQMKKSIPQSTDDIPSDSNLFAILNTLNKDGLTNADTTDHYTFKKSAIQYNHSSHKSTSVQPLKSNFSESGAILDTNLPEKKSKDNSSSSYSTHRSKQFTPKRAKSFCNNSNKNMLATPIMLSTTNDILLPVTRHKSVSSEDKDENINSCETITTFSHKIHEPDTKFDHYDGEIANNLQGPIPSVEDNFNISSLQLDFFQRNLIDDNLKYKFSEKYQYLLNSNAQGVGNPGILYTEVSKILNRDQDEWNEKLTTLNLGYSNVNKNSLGCMSF